MKPETQTIGDCAVKRLEVLLADVERDTTEAIQQNDIPTAVIHFNAFRELARSLSERVAALQKHVDSLSYEILPTMFDNQGVKTIKLDDVGRVTVNVRWNARMLNKTAGMDWLRASGNDGLIIETVNAQTLSSFAKERALEGKPLPSDTFEVGTAPYISITKG